MKNRTSAPVDVLKALCMPVVIVVTPDVSTGVSDTLANGSTSSGTNTLVFGTTTVTVGPNTQVTEFGESTSDSTGIAQISIGSRVYAFGTAGTTGATLDASAGRVRVGQTVASGLVTAQGSGGTTLTATNPDGSSSATR